MTVETIIDRTFTFQWIEDPDTGDQGVIMENNQGFTPIDMSWNARKRLNRTTQQPYYIDALTHDCIEHHHHVSLPSDPNGEDNGILSELLAIGSIESDSQFNGLVDADSVKSALAFILDSLEAKIGHLVDCKGYDELEAIDKILDDWIPFCEDWQPWEESADDSSLGTLVVQAVNNCNFIQSGSDTANKWIDRIWSWSQYGQDEYDQQFAPFRSRSAYGVLHRDIANGIEDLINDMNSLAVTDFEGIEFSINYVVTAVKGHEDSYDQYDMIGSVVWDNRDDFENDSDEDE